MELRSLTVIASETHLEADLPVHPPTRKVAACAVLKNPLAARDPLADLAPLCELSFEAGTVLTRRALQALGGLEPRAYSKGAIVGTGGALEHGAAMIHVRIDLAVRRAFHRRGLPPALEQRRG